MEYLKALLEVAYHLAYDGLPPAEGGPVLPTDPVEIEALKRHLEEWIAEEWRLNAIARG